MTTVILEIGYLAGLDFIKSNSQPDLDQPVQPLNGHLYRFFYFMAALNLVNTLFFFCYSIRKSQKRERRDLERTVAAFIQSNFEDSVRSSPGPGP